MRKWITALIWVALIPLSTHAQLRRNEDLKRIYFNLYTDSIKTALHYYVNVEGEYTDGRYLPLDTNTVIISADNGMMSGNDWIAPKEIRFEKVTFRVSAKGRPELRDQVTVWLKRSKDPRDEGEEMNLPYPGSERKGYKR
jgi:hypothetical protein